MTKDSNSISNKIILYLIGKPGVGKYTIACELEKRGFVVCDNQLANNPIFSLLQYDGFTKIPAYAWNVIKKIRGAIFDFILLEPNNNYVLTNVLNEDEGDNELYKQVKKLASDRKSHFIPVKLSIAQDEHIKRISYISRRDRYKSIDLNDAYDTTPLLSIDDKNLLEIDVTNLSAIQSAEKILDHINTTIKA